MSYDVYCMLSLLLIIVSIVFVDFFFFFKQKTAYEMRISDWSSDVCSSDLPLCRQGTAATDRGWQGRCGEQSRLFGRMGGGWRNRHDFGRQRRQIGRASCRERVCQYV